MTLFKRLIAQTHDIHADNPAQADQIARIRARAVDTMLRRLHMGTAWAPAILPADSDELTDLLEGVVVCDEIDPGDHRNPYPGTIAAIDTALPQQLLAWRDTAVKQALRAAIPATALDDLRAIREDAAASINDPARRLAALHRIITTAARIADGLDLSAAGWEDGITWSCAHHGEAGDDTEHCPTCIETGVTSAPAPAASSDADPGGWDEPLPAAVYSDHDGETD
jgi:hypothetical protein